MLYRLEVRYKGAVLAKKEERYKDALVALNASVAWGNELVEILRVQMKDLTGNKVKNTDFEFRVFEVLEQLPLFAETGNAQRS